MTTMVRDLCMRMESMLILHDLRQLVEREVIGLTPAARKRWAREVASRAKHLSKLERELAK